MTQYPNYYSQNGEDYILSQLFPNKDEGFFMEIGCIDGKRFSNTYYLELLGWKGICIEAHPDYIELIRKNRPNSSVIHAAIGETDKTKITFYANSRGTLSTLDKSKEKLFSERYGQYFSGFDEIEVEMKTINSVCKDLPQIDIVSIDIEGYEIGAMQGFDLEKYQPKVLIIESDDQEHERGLDKLILQQNFKKWANLNGNIFYLNNNYFSSSSNIKLDKVQLCHTRHPHDVNLKDEMNTFDPPNFKLYKTDESDFRKSVKKLLKSLIRRNIDDQKLQKKYELLPSGFHGDAYLQKIIDEIVHTGKIKYFIETGTNVASTLSYVAKRYPQIQCISCEPDAKSFQEAKANTSDLENVEIFNTTSQEFLSVIDNKYPQSLAENCLIWLDAHGYGFKWPILEEVEYFSSFKSSYMLIDDFKVPGKEIFEYDFYEEQECSHEYISKALSEPYHLYYPNYEKHTSNFHPLKGWGLYVFEKKPFLNKMWAAEKSC